MNTEYNQNYDAWCRKRASTRGRLLPHTLDLLHPRITHPFTREAEGSKPEADELESLARMVGAVDSRDTL